jgi:pimeloyl-ACP methyl ester carboxylesterase
VFGHRPFAVLADHLTREGILVLRYDDRGVERSGGEFEEATPEDFASDVSAGVRYLERRKDVDEGRIGLIGHSEGGILAAMVASQVREVKFIVLLATPTVPGEQTLYLQGEALMRANGAGEEAIAGNRRIQQAVFGVVKQGLEPDETYRRVAEAIEEAMAELPEETRELLSSELTPKAIDAQARAVSTEWFRDFITFDPADALKKVKVPVLALYGEKDLQVPPGPNIEALRSALRRGGNSDLTVVELPGLNHLFQTAVKGTVDEYGRIEETFAPAAMDVIAEWISGRLGSSE